jgi:3-methyladenine DNA glycosylase AlkD
MATATKITNKLKRLATPEKAAILARFFKTGPGEYGAGDIFLGITVPQIRNLVRQNKNLPLGEIKKLLASKYHEIRMAGVLCMAEKTKKADAKTRKALFVLYLKNAERINNWDLVDLSAPAIVGEYLLLNPAAKKILNALSGSANLWRRRIAIIATFAFIRARKFGETYFLAKKYFSDHEDLIAKASGWMLREAGKRDAKRLKKFLRTYAGKMPRTMLRYAIEKFPEQERKYFLRLPRR